MHKLQIPKTINWDNTAAGYIERHKLIANICETINELVVAVDKLQEMNKSCDNQIGILARNIAKLKHDISEKTTISKMENVDPYAEQRKWIGYLCWFWDDDYYLKTAGVLEEITTIEEEFHYAKQENCTVWKHCEPVKPDDDIIYKGGKDE